MDNGLCRRIARGVLCALLLSAASFPAGAEPLGNAVVDALNNHPSVEAAEANRAALGAQEQEQYSSFFPHLSVRGSEGGIYANNATSRGLDVTRGAGNSNFLEGSVALTQTIYDNRETSDRVSAATARVISADFSIADIRESLALRASLAYLDVLRSQESLALVRDHETLLQTYIQQIDGMVKSGAADKSMGVQAQDIIDQLRHTKSDIQGQMDSARADYDEIVGTVPADPMPKPVPALDLIPTDAEAAADFARHHHPALQAAAYKEQGLHEDSKADQAHIYPTVTGELSYDNVEQREVIGGKDVDARALVHLNWDYSLGGAEIAKMREAKQRDNEALDQREQQEREIINGIEKAYSKMQVADDQLKVTQDRQDLNVSLVENNKEQFQGAKMNILQVLQAENALFNAKLALVNDQYRLIAAQYDVLANMGRLVESLDIGPERSKAPIHVANR
jgi:adhesin transport system outer membrane protein